MISRLIDNVSKLHLLQIGNGLVYCSNLYTLKLFGQFIMISRTAWDFDDENDKRTFNSSKFIVYEVEISTASWEEVNSLHNMVVFIGHTTLSAVDASKFHGNHIYFTDDGQDAYHFYEEKGGGKDVEIKSQLSCRVELSSTNLIQATNVLEDKLSAKLSWTDRSDE